MSGAALAGGEAGKLAAAAGFVCVLGWLSVIDLRSRRLPDRIVLPTLWAGLILNAATGAFASPADAVFGTAAGYSVLWLIDAAYAVRGGERAAFGGGDLKLAAAIGAWIGWEALPAALVVAFVSGTCAVLPALMRGRVAMSQAVPFGPALALGGGAALVTGPSLAGLLSFTP